MCVLVCVLEKESERKREEEREREKGRGRERETSSIERGWVAMRRRAERQQCTQEPLLQDGSTAVCST